MTGPRMAHGPWILTFLVLVTCGGDLTVGPPEIQYGLEECGYCRMIISEQKYAAAIDEGGTATSFDDVGCLLDYLRENPGESGSPWVHDHIEGGWIAAEQAWFVRGPQTSTPMGSGLTAFASRQAADAVSRDAAADTVSRDAADGVMDWATLRGL